MAYDAKNDPDNIYINPQVAKMFGIPYSQLTDAQKKILGADSKRRARLIEKRQNAVLQDNLKAFEDEAKMEKILASIYKECQKEILADVSETIAKVQRDGGTWSYANQSALTRSRGLFQQIEEELVKLGSKENLIFTQGLEHIFTDQFLRTTYTLGQVINVQANFNKLNPAYVRATLNYPWSGAMFSDRLWNDKQTLGRNLRVGLTQSMILGENMHQITQRINKNLNTSESNAMRVARTETKRVTYCAHEEVLKDCGVKRVELMCASGACGVCLGVEKEYEFDDPDKPNLPIHPNCRCWYRPIVSDTFEDNELNELTGSIRGAENYEKWVEAQKDKTPVIDTPKAKVSEVTDTKAGGEVYTAELGKEIRGSFDTSGYKGSWGDYEEKTLQELYAQRDLLTDPAHIKQVNSIIKNHEEYKRLVQSDGTLVELQKSGTFKLKVPPSQSVEERIRNSEYYNRYSLVETSYRKYNYEVYEERLGGKYYITMSGVSSKKEQEEIKRIADSVFSKNPRAVGAKLRIDTKECAKQSSSSSICLGFYDPTVHKLTVRNFKSYAEIYGISKEQAVEKFAGTLSHEFAHIVHSKSPKLSKVVATEEQWKAWKDLVEPYYVQYRENSLVDFSKEWKRMDYPVNAEDSYRDRKKDHYYQEMWAECTAIVQENVSKATKEEEMAKLKKYFPKVAEFIELFYKGGNVL